MRKCHTAKRFWAHIREQHSRWILLFIRKCKVEPRACVYVLNYFGILRERLLIRSPIPRHPSSLLQQKFSFGFDLLYLTQESNFNYLVKKSNSINWITFWCGNVRNWLAAAQGSRTFSPLGHYCCWKNFIQLQSSFGSPLSHFYLSALRNSTGREKEGMIKTHWAESFFRLHRRRRREKSARVGSRQRVK